MSAATSLTPLESAGRAPGTMMDKGRALQCCKDIRQDLHRAARYARCAWKNLLELYEREGWRALGYESFVECARSEFDIKKSHSYRILYAAQVKRDIDPKNAFGELPERVLRELAPLKDPIQRREAFDEAVKDAGGSKPSLANIRHGVETVASRFAADSPVGESDQRPGQAPQLSPMGESDEACERDSGPAPNLDSEEPADVRRARAKGIIPEGGKVIVEEVEMVPPVEGEPDISTEQTDEEYLAECPARAKLSPIVRKRFDAEALAFRRITPARQKFEDATRQIRKEAVRAAGHHIGRWLNSCKMFTSATDPSRWLACTVCSGTGEESLVGKCAACHGEGYHVR